MEYTKLALTVEEAAAAGGPGRTKIFEAIRNGELTAHKAGRRTVILVEDYKSYLAALPVIQVSK